MPDPSFWDELANLQPQVRPTSEGAADVGRFHAEQDLQRLQRPVTPDDLRVLAQVSPEAAVEVASTPGTVLSPPRSQPEPTGAVSAQGTQVAAAPTAGQGGGAFTPEQILELGMRGGGGGGPRRTATTVQRVPNPLPPEVQSELTRQSDEAAGELQSARDALVSAQEDYAEQTAQEIERVNEAVEQSDAERQEARQQQMERLREQGRRLRELGEEAADLRVDPNRFYARQSTAQSIIGALSVALGGFAQGFSQGRVGNVALDIINDAINRDIDAQKANIAAKRGAFRDKLNLYQMNLNNLESEDAAYAASRAQMLKRSQANLRQLAAQSESELVGRRADVVNATLEQARVDALRQTAQAAAGVTQVQTVRRSGGGGASPLKRLKNVAATVSALREAGLIQAGDSEETQAQVLQLADRVQKFGLAGAQSAVDEVRSRLGAAGVFSRALARVPIARMLTSEQVRNLDNALFNLSSLIVKSRSGAQVAEPEVRRLARAQGLRLDATPEEMRAGLERAEAELRANAQVVFGAFPPNVVSRFLEGRQREMGAAPRLQTQPSSFRRE